MTEGLPALRNWIRGVTFLLIVLTYFGHGVEHFCTLYEQKSSTTMSLNLDFFSAQQFLLPLRKSAVQIVICPGKWAEGSMQSMALATTVSWTQHFCIFIPFWLIFCQSKKSYDNSWKNDSYRSRPGHLVAFGSFSSVTNERILILLAVVTT